MHALIVVAHHDPESLTHAIAAEVARGVAESAPGNGSAIADLFREGFDPRFNPADHAVHRHQATPPADVLAEQARIDGADALQRLGLRLRPRPALREEAAAPGRAPGGNRGRRCRHLRAPRLPGGDEGADRPRHLRLLRGPGGQLGAAAGVGKPRPDRLPAGRAPPRPVAVRPGAHRAPRGGVRPSPNGSPHLSGRRVGATSVAKQSAGLPRLRGSMPLPWWMKKRHPPYTPVGTVPGPGWANRPGNWSGRGSFRRIRRPASVPPPPVAHETCPYPRRRPGRPDDFVRPGARVHRLRPGGAPQPADGPVWRDHHLHPDGAVRRPAGHGVRGRRLHGRGDRRAGGAARRAVPAGHGAAGRSDHDGLRVAAPGQAGAHGAAPGDAGLRQRPGDRHRAGPAGAFQDGRGLAVGQAAGDHARPGGADHGHRLPAAAPDPRHTAGPGGDPRHRPAGPLHGPVDAYPRRHGAHRRRPADVLAARGAVEPGNAAHHRALCAADGDGRPAGNPIDPQPHRRDHREPGLPGPRMRGPGRGQHGLGPVRRHGRLRDDRPDGDQPRLRRPWPAFRGGGRRHDPALRAVPLAADRAHPAGRAGGRDVRGIAADLRLGLAAGAAQGAGQRHAGDHRGDGDHRAHRPGHGGDAGHRRRRHQLRLAACPRAVRRQSPGGRRQQALPGPRHAVLRLHHALPQSVRPGGRPGPGDPGLPPPELRRLLGHRRADDPARALRQGRQAPARGAPVRALQAVAQAGGCAALRAGFFPGQRCRHRDRSVDGKSAIHPTGAADGTALHGLALRRVDDAFFIHQRSHCTHENARPPLVRWPGIFLCLGLAAQAPASINPPRTARPCRSRSVREDVLAGAEVEHLLGLGDAADGRAGEAAATEDEGDGQLFVDGADLPDYHQGAVDIQQCHVGRDVVARGHGVDDQVEAGLRGAHGLLVGGHQQAVGAQGLGVVGLVGAAAEHGDFGTQADGELDRHVAEAAEADHAHAAAGADVPGAQRRVAGDAGAQQRRRLGQVEAFRHAQDELLAHHQVLGVTAESDFPGDAVTAVVGLGVALAAQLLLALAALVALHAGIHHAAHCHVVADLVARHRRADLDHPADDLVAGHDGVQAEAPVVARLVQVGVADAAVEDFHRHVVGAQFAALELEGCERCSGGLRGITDCEHEQYSRGWGSADASAFDGIGGIGIAGGRGVPGGHQAVHQALVVRAELQVEGAQVGVPLRFGARAGDGRGEQAVVQHPGQGEGDRGGAPAGGVFGQGAGDVQRLGAPFGLLDALVAAASTGVGGRRCIHRVLAGEHATGQRAVGDHAQAVVPGGGQLLHLGGAVDDVVQRLAGHGPVDAEGIGQARHLGDAPATEVGNAVVAHLALGDQLTDGAHGFVQRLAGEGTVDIEQVDAVGAQAPEAGLHRLEDPLARQALLVGALAEREAELGGQHPVVASRGDGASDDLLGAAGVVDVRRVDEVDALLEGLVDDAPGGGFVGLAAEHHGAQAQGRDFEGAAPQVAVIHGCLHPVRLERVDQRRLRSMRWDPESGQERRLSVAGACPVADFSAVLAHSCQSSNASKGAFQSAPRLARYCKGPPGHSPYR
ncbi:hypothetical protein Lal_00003742 [Lupinus albus]|nr:hypothetical protein Lal_00003742 [Lupinus albus]